MIGLKNIKKDMIDNQVKINLKDKTLFGNEAGEDEDIEILNSYFLEKPIFDDFYENTTKLAVISGRKGMGKSALLSKLEYILKDDKKYNNPIVIKTTGTELLGLGDFQNMNDIQLENYWKQIICKKINLEIGKTLKFAFSDDEMTLVESAEIDNMKSENILSALITRLSSKVPLTDLERDKKVPSDWKALLTRYQDKHKNSNVWILIDDIDAKFQNNKQYQDIVSSFFSALRSLIKVNNLNIRASVRTDVWNSLTHIEDLDKWEQYITEIIWTRNEMKEILAKRILAYLIRKHPQSSEAKYNYKTQSTALFNLVFEKTFHWSNRDQEFYKPLTVIANKRPRWMGQLCNMAAKNALESKNTKITAKNIIDILEEYGKKRVADLEKEHTHQFSLIKELTAAFRAGERAYKKDVLLDKIIERFEPLYELADRTVDGASYSTEQVAKFLYKTGFISMVEDENTYINFQDDPDLFDCYENITNELTWAIHPSYRNHLRIK